MTTKTAARPHPATPGALMVPYLARSAGPSKCEVISACTRPTF
jgi:hypothetical protein